MNLILGALVVMASSGSVPTAEICIRDPFVLPVVSEDKYYLYGTNSPEGFDCYTSTDLEHWSGPSPAFRPGQSFWANRDFWAPEVYLYRGRYYMFASFKPEGKPRFTGILVSDKPGGPFEVHSDGPVTPGDWECLDGTLYLAPDGAPWIVFCHEWVQVHDGEICAQRLTSDLKRSAGRPMVLFRASEAPWAHARPDQTDFVTDGPFFHKAANGELLMLWSSFSPKGYTLGVARSASGRLSGPWTQDEKPLFEDDGGHGMLFRTFEGEFMLSFHAPNHGPTRPHFRKIRDIDGRLVLE